MSEHTSERDTGVTNAVLELMEHQGGSFIRSLAHCYMMADQENKRRLRIAMHNWFSDYAKKVDQIRDATTSAPSPDDQDFDEKEFVDQAVSRYQAGVDRLRKEGRLAPAARCDRPPTGWECSRGRGHEGPCAASEI